MVVLGLICLVVGYIVPISVLVTVGYVLVGIGILLLVLGAIGHPVGGRYWY